MNTDQDGSEAKSCTPLRIQPLNNRKISPEEGTGGTKNNGSYRIIQKLITTSPNRELPGSEIETALEAFVAPNGDCLWRRVAVWSGPCSPQRVIHASYVLPSTGDSATQNGCIFDPPVDSSLSQPSLVCWAAFPERPEHKLLCVLVSPSTLSIWDVYPDSDEVYVSGEGHSVSLPFQCCAIHPLGENHGLLLQRKEEHDDFEAQKGAWGAFHNLNASQASEEGDDFFLKIPPRNTRMGEDGATASHATGAVGLTASPRSAFGPAEVSSLFSLKHPLEDVLPVMRNPETGSEASLVTDVFESVLYTGVLRWTDHADDYLDKKQHAQPICVTYHSIRKRHAIWALKGAPTPPSAPALWQRSRYWRSSEDWESHIGMLDQDMEDMELLGVASDGSAFAGPTRDEALADALGVRRTPRRSMEGGQRGRGLESLSHNRAEATSVNRSTFVQGAPRSVKDTFYMDADVSFVETPQLLNLRPLSNLHPSVALDCLYEESNESSPATNVFLSSNLEGSGLLVLGLVTARSDGEVGENLNVLRLISFEPSLDEPLAEQEIDSHDFVGTLSESLRHTFSVKMLSEEVCIAAQPIQATPIPPCHLPHQRHRNGNVKELATDILILRNDAKGQSLLCLHRAQTYIFDCALSKANDERQPASSYITDIQNPVHGSIEIITGNDLEDGTSIRGSISLLMKSNALAEKVLNAIENSMFRKSEALSRAEPLEFALKLRADCCRLEQELDSDTSSHGLAAFEALFACIVDFELFGVRPGAPSRSVTDNSGSPWPLLLDSSFHASYFADNSDVLFLGDTDGCFSDRPSRRLHLKEERLRTLLSSIGSHALCTLSGMTVVPDMFDTLHLLYEDLKLYSVSNKPDQMRSVGFCLVRAFCAAEASIAGRSMFLEHYARDLGSEWVNGLRSYFNERKFPTKGDMVQITSFDRPPCILSWVDALIKEAASRGVYNVDDISTINAACNRTRTVLRIFSLLFQFETNSQNGRDYEVVSAMVEEGFTDAMKVRDELPIGIAIPLLEVLNRCRDDPELGTLSGWTADKFTLVGRQDLSKNNGNDSLGVPRNNANKTVPVRVSDRDNPTFSDKDKDGLVPLEVTSSMLFPDDNRIREAGRLLRSSRPCFLSVPRSVEVSDHDYERLKQNKLLLLCRRALALPVGRGMVTIGTFQPVAAEPLPVPDLCLVGRIPPTNTSLALDLSECQSDFKIWPEFHNGVAAGLRLPLEGKIEESISKITRTWIVYNRPTAAPEAQPPNQGNQPPTPPTINSHAHGGLLLALGLRGHLASLEMTDLYDYLTQGQVTLTCGVLLGMAANLRGKCDISVSKMLCLHLPSLIPQHFSAIDVASPVQTAAVAGAGLLFQGSCHRMMTEFLLNEIGRRPESDVALDREAYTLSCGIALGMVNLCKGDRIHDGQSAGGGEGLADLRISERLYRYIVGGTDDEEARRMREANDRLNLPTTSSSENERCSCVFEGANINIDVTAAGATLAIGLIFMKTGNANIASAIALPDTHFLLEYVRPDFLALRVLSKALILWDDVEPSNEWIARQLPPVVRNAYKQMQVRIKKATDLGDVFSENRRDSLGEGSASDRQPQDYDCQAVRQIYVHIVAGACFGIGLRFAGTADKRASAAIFERVIELQTLRDANDSISAAMRPEEQILDTCLGCCAISLAMVNAGTGDLEVLKLLKILRWRCDDQVKYGTHQSLGMAIGLLFLGGGTCTLGREPEDIAALVAAFFPRFPYSTTDNQYHLQALRHLYALAVKRRDLRFVDVDTGENIQEIPIEIEYKDQGRETVRLMAPCLLRNADGPALGARIISDHFYPMRFNLNKTAFGRPCFVKRRSENHSSGEGEDLDLQLSLLVQTGNFRGGGFCDLSGNAYIRAYAQYLCGSMESSGNKRAKRDTSVEAFCTSIIHECLPQAEVSLPVYLGLWNSIESIEANSSSAPQSSWDFRLIRSYYESRSGLHCPTARPVLSIEKVAYLTEFITK